MRNISDEILYAGSNHRWIFDNSCNVPVIPGTRIHKHVVWWDMVGVGFDLAKMSDVRWIPFLLGIYEGCSVNDNPIDHWVYGTFEVPMSIWEEKVGATLTYDVGKIESYRYLYPDRYIIVGEKPVRYTVVEYLRDSIDRF